MPMAVGLDGNSKLNSLFLISILHSIENTNFFLMIKRILKPLEIYILSIAFFFLSLLTGI